MTTLLNLVNSPMLLLAFVIVVVVTAISVRRITSDLKWFTSPPSYTQAVRSFVTITFIGAYAYGFLLVVQRVTTDPNALQDVEGFGLVLALVGGYVERIIDKLYAEQKD